MGLGTEESSVPGVAMFGHLSPGILWSSCEVGDILEQRSCYNFVSTVRRMSVCSETSCILYLASLKFCFSPEELFFLKLLLTKC